MKASRILAVVAFIITLAVAGRAQAIPPDEYVPPMHWNGRAVILPAMIFRNGDWFAVGAVGVVSVGSLPYGHLLVATSRAEVGIGGANVAVGLGTSLDSRSSKLNEALMAGGLLGVEARFARMYGPTSWQRTNYGGLQVALALPYGMMKLTGGGMVNLRDHADARIQIGFGVAF